MNGPPKNAQTAIRAFLAVSPAPAENAAVPAMSSANGLSEAPDVTKASIVARNANRPQIVASISKPFAACERLKKDMRQLDRFSEA